VICFALVFAHYIINLFNPFNMANPLCPTGCESALPPVAFSQCAPEINYSEIQYIYVAKVNASPFNDWTQPGEWGTRLNQTTLTGNNYIRQLVVIADKPAPAATNIDISGDRTILVEKTHTLNVTVDETNAINHEFVRYLECGGQVRIWYQTRAGLLFGGNSGIRATMSLDPILNRGRDQIMTFTGTVTWRAKFSPEMAVSPIVGTGDITPPASYDSTIVFATSATPAAVAGVAGTADAVDPDQKLEFNAINPRIGTPATMTIELSGVEDAVFDFTTDYIGQVFRYTDTAAVVHIGQFTIGTVNF
jgi:hypothetical protein